MTKSDEKRKSGWKLAAVGALICFGGLVSCVSAGGDITAHSKQEAVAHHNRGMALYGQGKYFGAEAAFRRVIELEPTSMEAHFNLGAALSGQGRLVEAAESYRRAGEM